MVELEENLKTINNLKDKIKDLSESLDISKQKRIKKIRRGNIKRGILEKWKFYKSVRKNKEHKKIW